MSKRHTETASPKPHRIPERVVSRFGRRLVIGGICFAVLAVLLTGLSIWIGSKATTVKTELFAAQALIPTLKTQIANNDSAGAAVTVESLVRHTGAAREETEHPLWKAASLMPLLGPNFQAAAEVATSADDVARLGAVPLVKAFQSLDWTTLTPTPSGMDLKPLADAAPHIQAAAHAVRESSKRLDGLDANALVPQIAEPLETARKEMANVSDGLNTAADAAYLAPRMLGSEGTRRYLLLIQNNAEARATGGIPGALAVLKVDKGILTLESQKSAGDLGTFSPPIPTDAEQQAIYSARIGKFMQDVNLTPDFATTASVAQIMWGRSTGEELDGVLSLDPVALSFILEATGPVQIADPVVQQIGHKLPAQLTSANVVGTLLSDAYSMIDEPRLQDIYFAGAAKEVFHALSSGKTDPKKLISAVSKGVEERRVLLWSASAEEQRTIAQYSLGGLVSGSAISPAQFGIYFNDGTGAKMDYWIKRTVQVVKDCTRDGYREVSVRVTSTNTAPADAATSLPSYVTGNGAFGVPAGSVQTNVVAYGPAQSNIDTVVRDGVTIPFAAQHHRQRAVGTSTIRLAPGESTTLDFNFGHIVQHTEPELAVTPTTQAVKDVVQNRSLSSCE